MPRDAPTSEVMVSYSGNQDAVYAMAGWFAVVLTHWRRTAEAGIVECCRQAVPAAIHDPARSPKGAR